MTDRTYTRDEVSTMLAAEREAALRKALDAVEDSPWNEAVRFSIAQAILALIDQPSALDSVREAERDRCAKIAERVLQEYAAEKGNTKTPGGRTAIFYKRKVAAAIRGEQP